MADAASDRAPEFVTWQEGGQGGNTRRARWHSGSGVPAPKRVEIVDDALDAGTALRMAREGTGLLWRGDFHNARQLLAAMARKIDGRSSRQPPADKIDADAFHRWRMQQAQRARTLGLVLLPFEADHGVALRRAPDLRDACDEAWGRATQPYVASLRDLQGAVGAYEWRKKGVAVPALKAKVYPHYGVFAPIRSEYVELVGEAPLPDPLPEVAFDIGTGTGVLAALLARRGIARVIATDTDPRAVASARETVQRLGLAQAVDVQQVDLFPEGTAGLIVCNPPWLSGKATSPLERAVYDTDSRMLKGFLAGVAAHLAPQGEAWLVMSDIAEHLGLRTRDDLQKLIDDASLVVVDRLEIEPVHPRASDRSDPLHAARSREVTSLWRLAKRDAVAG